MKSQPNTRPCTPTWRPTSSSPVSPYQSPRGVVAFTPTSTSRDAQTVYTACEVKGYLVDGVLRTHPNGGARGVQLIAPARYNVQVSARTGTARQIIIDCIPITVQPGQELNLATLMDDGFHRAPPRHLFRFLSRLARLANGWRLTWGDGTAKIIERDKNE